MRQRPRILRKLGAAQHPYILDPLDAGAAHVLAEQLVAQHGEAFLETQLEPVAAGHPVARPIVEVFVRHHTLDPIVIAIGGGVGIGQDVARVEHVEALVFHRPHVEIGHRNDVEQVQIVFAPESLLVPLHRGFERLHRMPGAAFIAGANPDVERHRAPAHRHKAIVVGDQIACDQCKQIARLGPRIVPLSPVRAVGTSALRGAVAVRQQNRKRSLIAAHPHPVGREHIGPVREKGDPAKPLGLALGAQHPVRGIEPHQLRVARWIERGFKRHLVRLTGQIDQQFGALHPPRVAGCAVDQHARRGQPVAIEAKHMRSAIAADRKLGGDPRRCNSQRKIERNLGHQPRRRLIIGAADDPRAVDMRRRRRGIGRSVERSVHFAVVGARSGQGQAQTCA